MALLKFLKGNYAGLNNAAINEGQILICGDTGEMFVDVAADKRVKIGDFITVANIAALEALDATAVPTSRLYYVEDGNILARSNGTAWVQVNKQKTADELKTMLGLGDLAYKSEVAEGDLNADLAAKINASTAVNHSHANKDVLDGITAEKVAAWDSAESNAKSYADGLATGIKNDIIGDIAEGKTVVDIVGEAVYDDTQVKADIKANADAIDAIKDGAAVDSFADVEAELVKKVDKVEGKSLVDDAEITKLAGVSEGANKVEKSDTNGNIKVDGSEVVVYTHPEKHAIADVDGLQDALDGLQAKGDYAAEEHTHTASEITDLDATIKAYDYATKAEAQAMADGKDDAIAEAKKAGTDAAAALEAYKTANDKAIADHIADADGKFETKTDAGNKLAEAKKYTDDAIAAIPAQTDYSVTITENTDDATVAKTYVFSQCGAEIGSIKLAKELVVTAGSVKEVTEADAPYAGAVVGEKYIELVIANQDAPIYVPAKDLVDIYTAKDGAAEVQVAISNTNEISATLVNGGVTEEKLAEAVKTKLNKVYEEVGVAKGLVDALADGQVKTNKEAIEAINDAENGILAQAKADAKSKADAAEANAKGYADTELAKDRERLTALEAIDHDYAGADATLKAELQKEIDDDVKAAIDAEVLRADGAYDKKGDAAAAQSAAEAKAAELDAALKTELQGEIDADVKVVSDVFEGYKTSNDAEVAKKANSADVYAKTETYTQAEVDAAIEAAITEAHTWGSF